MSARNYADKGKFRDAEFQLIVAGMRELLRVCNLLATALAANNIYHIEKIDAAVIQLVKNCGNWLTNTLGKRIPRVPPPGNPGVPRALVIVHGTILPPGAPAQWGPATAEPNTDLVSQNTPPANIPQPGPANRVNDPARSASIPQMNVPIRQGK